MAMSSRSPGLGTFFSYARFPDAMQPFVKALPLTALNDALRAVMIDGTSVGPTDGDPSRRRRLGGCELRGRAENLPLAVSYGLTVTVPCIDAWYVQW